MRYLTVLGDGMADRPHEALRGKTPLECAHIPAMDALAGRGRMGLVCNVPAGMSPGSDVANLSAMGFDPRPCYTGRSPLEAVSMGIALREDDVAFRVNLVTLSDEPELARCRLLDYSAGEISNAEARELIEYLCRRLDLGERRLYAGKSYRHCLVWPAGPLGCALTPPHDIQGQALAEHLPAGEAAAELRGLIAASRELLREHPLNRRRRAAGKRPASCLWPWGLGTRPTLPLLAERYGLKGAVISAVDLVQGIGKAAGMEVPLVAGATGTLSSNFAGKAAAAVEAFRRGADYVYVHLEAPDECGHQGDAPGKVRAIEIVDAAILRPLWDWLEAERRAAGEDYRIFVLPDHPTPLALRTHTADPVPFLLFDSAAAAPTRPEPRRFSERAALEADPRVHIGHELAARYLSAASIYD